MEIKKAEFVTSGVKMSQYPQGPLPEVAFAGRSNVGKSSLLNKLVRRKKLARVSKQPGRTRTINFFRVNDQFHLVDLPGYGFARVPASVKRQWGRMIEEYLSKREQLRGVVLLLDIRHKPTVDDQQMVEWLVASKVPTIFVATKADKISRGKRQKHLSVIRKTLELPPDQPVIAFSAETGEGKDVLLSGIERLINSD
ncbi:MAG: YihA family ribosome biogenesis GTP-binding protein [Thermoanaerobacteraceae bacterium]|nr:YihA family ribosome biogenesis GTP-binding protein [Thermoanaerobacteraceae bacterium]